MAEDLKANNSKTKKKEECIIKSCSRLARDIYDMHIETDLACEARPGQFIMVYPKDKSMMLPRPISICEADRENKALRIVYRALGSGTKEFSRYKAGDSISIMGLLGNGFPLEEAKGKRAALMGGGIGIPPIVQLAKDLPGDKYILAGFRDGELFLKDDLSLYAPVYVATEDGSAGTKGNVMDALKALGDDMAPEIIFACGPMPMLRAIKAYAKEKGIMAYISLEERMACGVGACLGCVCKTTEIDSHSHVGNARVCADGPVFEAGRVDI